MEENPSPPGFSSQNPSYSSHSLESGSSISPLQYYGIQKRNYYKEFEKDITQLINYVFSISPPFKIVHKIMSIMRIIQFLLPCLLPAYLNFWKEGTIDTITVNVIEIFCYIIPPREARNATIPFLIFYDVVQLLIILIMITSSYYLKKNAKLPSFISPFIHLYHSTFGHFFDSIVLYLIFELISRLSMKNIGKVFISKSIVVIFISLICFVFNNFFMSNFTSQTLVFRPCSLPSVTSYPQFIIYMSTMLINSFFGIAVNLKKTCQIVFLSLNFAIYLLSIISVFFRGGFIHLYISNFVLSSSITGAVFTIVDLVFILMNKEASLAILFILIIFFVLMLVVNFFILQNIDMNKLKVLDSIYADESLFSYVRSSNQFLQLALCGIKHAHPIVISLNFFKMAIDKWPKDQCVYFIYAKFVAIYPEETITLKYIYQAVQIQKLTGISINSICNDTKQILKQRESGIPSELRQKINKIKRQTQSTRHKLGHAWDVVIRGNINEIESATVYAIESMNETNTDYKHLLHEYPNNRNVTYIYGNFLEDIMADHQMAMKMHEKTKKMLPGVNYEDQTHKFGLEMFSSLPGSIGLPNEQTLVTSTIDVAQSIQEKESKNDDECLKDYEQLAEIKKNIDELKMPAIIGIKIIETCLILFIFIIPFIFGMVFVEVYISDMQKLLPFINTLSLLHTYAYQIISFSIRHVAESLSIFRKYPMPDIDPPRIFGNSWDTEEQLEYLLPVITKELQDFTAFRKFKESNKFIQEAKSYIFDDIINYDYYVSDTNITKTNTSIQGAILDFIIQTKIILSAYEINESILTSGMILNPINNISPISMNIENTMEIFIEYIFTKYLNIKRIGTIILAVIVVFVIVIYVISLIAELKLINSNKREVFKCLFSIPKKVISQLDDNRFSKMKDNQAEEINKQEDNILKVFNSSGAYHGPTSNITILSIETVIIVCLSITCITLFIVLIIQSAEAIRNQSGHLHYISGSYSMILSSINYLNIMLFSAAGHPIPTFDFDLIYSRMAYAYERSRYYYHIVIAGGNLSYTYPFKEIIQGIQIASGKNCSYLDLYQDKNILLSINNIYNEAEVLQCTPVDMAFTLIEPIISYSMIPHQTGYIENLDPNNLIYETIWIYLISPLYELFFEPLHNEIIPSISNEIKHLKNKYIPIISVLFVVGVFLESFVYYQASKIEGYIKATLRLILHCNPSVIFSSSKITRVLSGDFSFQQSDSLDKNNNFFDTVFTSLPDSIIIANNDMIIQSANKACKHTFGDIELVGKSLKDFFMSKEFDGNVEALFSLVNTNQTEKIAYKKDANSDVKILKASSMMACGKFIMYCKDVTQSHNYNILIQEEKQNSDMLLSTILPPSLVSRVQEGEKNISFSVQSASILFADIVNFTPWCGSLPAEKVMSTLNILFRRFDSILDKKPTLTKIKCIGDCYMAAGGIFAQINQPSVHAKEIVSFGLLAIKEIQLINDEIHENLRIRVGINSGGPIVAGVLGIGKPTFEIIGPAINRAQQMEQNGVPMKVHISMSVYQLICGFNFNFGQRRKIELKNETVETYLVEP